MPVSSEPLDHLIVTVERRPFSGQCQADVKNQSFRRWTGRNDMTCGRITDIVQNGEWRCGYHTDSQHPAFVVKGQIVGEEATA